MKDNPATRQRGFRKLGMFLQTFGGATNWITLAIFLFSGMSAWSSPAMLEIRRWLPWLSFLVFLGIIFIGILVLMWLQHKYAQPSIMVYWNKMWYEQDNPMTADIQAIKKKLEIKDETR
jgi:uncharacterized protein involved in cysteine biosynthesis